MASTDTLTTNGSAATVFRRARPADAIDVALEMFLAESRVDIQTLASRLDVSPATLHRWFGSRAQLLDRVFEAISHEFGAAARRAAQGSGDERVCDYARRLMTDAAVFQPMRSFAAREPQLALRLLLGEHGAVHRVVAEHTRAALAEERGAEQADLVSEQIEVIVQVATALVWATFMIGEEPQIDRAVTLIRLILASRPAG
jgi:AcrR family transcriptional regulator